MLPVLGKAAESTLPLISSACFLGAAAFAGRKFVPGVACKAVGFAAKLLDNQNADAWNLAGDAYLIAAKKDAPRDLAFAAGCIVLGITAGSAGCAVAELNKPEKEPSYLDTAKEYYEGFRDQVVIPVAVKAYEYRTPLMIATIMTGLFYGKVRRAEQNKLFDELAYDPRFEGAMKPKKYEQFIELWEKSCREAQKDLLKSDYFFPKGPLVDRFISKID